MLNNNEIWTTVENLSNYEISSKGSIKSKLKNRIMKTWKNNSGYSQISLVDDRGITVKWLVHRLVATAFLPNPINLPYVNHKDGNKQNNEVDNLEWCTCSENILHARKTGLNPYNFPTKGRKLSGKKKSLSSYHGVSFDKNRGKWIGSLRVNGKNYKQKRFDTELEAAKHYNSLVLELGLDRPLNVIV